MSNDAPAALNDAATDDSIDPLAELEFDETTGKRAVYEEFEFSPGVGHVDVENASHGTDGDDHTYRVDIVDGVPTRCACPAFEYHCAPGEACKHMVATALRPTLCEVVEAGADDQDEPAVATDGGDEIVVAGDQGEVLEDARDLQDDVDDAGEVYTYHWEPYEQGGARYVRCEHCGAECVPADPDRLAHFEGCPEGRR